MPCVCGDGTIYYVQWIGDRFGACVYTGRDIAAFFFGLTNICCWLCAQAPQLYINFKNKSVEALSFWFLFTWLCGDVTNLLGCIFTHQLPVQLYTAIYFCFVDFFMMTQYIWYQCCRGGRQATKVALLNHDTFTEADGDSSDLEPNFDTHSLNHSPVQSVHSVLSSHDGNASSYTSIHALGGASPRRGSPGRARSGSGNGNGSGSGTNEVLAERHRSYPERPMSHHSVTHLSEHLRRGAAEELNTGRKGGHSTVDSEQEEEEEEEADRDPQSRRPPRTRHIQRDDQPQEDVRSRHRSWVTPLFIVSLLGLGFANHMDTRSSPIDGAFSNRVLLSAPDRDATLYSSSSPFPRRLPTSASMMPFSDLPISTDDDTNGTIVVIAKRCDATDPTVSIEDLIGDISAWVSAAMYFYSRIPQILLVHRTKSMEGLSFPMFLLATMGNTCYAISVVLPTDNPGLHGNDFWNSTLAYLIGSVGPLVLSLVIFYQFYLYRWKSQWATRRGSSGSLNYDGLNGKADAGRQRALDRSTPVVAHFHSTYSEEDVGVDEENNGSLTPSSVREPALASRERHYSS